MICGDDRGVGLHLAIDHQAGRALPDQIHGAADLVGQRMPRAAEVGEAEHRHARLLVEAPRLFGRHDRDLRQVLGGRLDVDRGVGQEVDVALAA